MESPRRGALRITARGKQILGDNPTRIDVKYLERFPEFIEFRDASRNNRETTTTESVAIATEQTPEEALELAHQSLRVSLAQDILSRILSCSPTFFERLVVELLVKMGYGGSRRDAGERIGQSGDGGIDGIIKEDRLGFPSLLHTSSNASTPTTSRRAKLVSNPALHRGRRDDATLPESHLR